MKPHWKNISLKPISEIIDGVVYNENWLPIIGYEGLYMISDFGRVKSLKRKVKHYRGGLLNKNDIILKQGLDVYGYPQVLLCKDGKSKNKKIHQLVAKHFIENPKNKLTVNHKFGIKTDNRKHQLEWFTGKEQMIHASKVLNRKMGLRWGNGKDNPKSKKVNQIDSNGRIIATYEGTRDAERKTGINRCGISQVCNKTKYYITAGGYKWEYI